MKLSEHVEHIRQLIDQAFRNRLGRMDINEGQLTAIENMPAERKRMETIREVFIAETGTVADAYEKLVEELTFTLFNRLAALKVMEAHTLHPEIVTRRESHGGRSFAHLAWLEQNPNARNEEAEGLLSFLEDQLQKLASDIPLFSPQHPYHLLPTALELQGIINAFNQVETDTQVETEIWKSDDVLGWLYESYNNYKKAAHKASGNPTEYNKVSIQSQWYTPRWVVQFLVDNSLGKLYLEMYPDSEIRNKYKIANAPTSQTRERKPLHEIRMIDPSTGSGNYLLYGFDMYYDLYDDVINNQGNPDNYDEADVPKLIIEHNLHGVDLDDRAIQLAQLGLYIKAKRKKRTAKIEHFNIVSSDFFLPAYDEVKDIFEDGNVGERERKIIEDLWEVLQNAHKFGSLIRLEEKLNLKWFGTKDKHDPNQVTLFGQQNLEDYDNFRNAFFTNLQKAVAQNTAKQGQTFLNIKTQDAITFLQLLTQKYDVAVANPPYTDSADFGPELKLFIEDNYKKPYKFNANLYAAFIKRCSELVNPDGYLGLLHPLTFMYISSFKEVRKYILTKTTIDTLAELGLGGVFANVQADVVAYTLKNSKSVANSVFLDFKKYKNHTNKPDIFAASFDNLVNNRSDEHTYHLSQNAFKDVEDWPFIYWISDRFRKKFREKSINDVLNPRQGIATGDNLRCVRFWWEINKDDISEKLEDDKKWKFYSKGGPYNKWFGNNWTVIDYSSQGYNYLLNNGNHLPSRNFYFKEGVTYCASGSKGVSFRHMPSNFLFDVGGSCIFPGSFENINYYIAFLNSKLSFYIAKSLNPTVNTQVGDLKRIPFVIPSSDFEAKISNLSKENIEIKKKLECYQLINTLFSFSPLIYFNENLLKDRLISFLNFYNYNQAVIIINEAILNDLIFKVYELNQTDIKQVIDDMGILLGDLPIDKLAKQEFLYNNTVSNQIAQFVGCLEDFNDDNLKREIKENFNSLYQGNSNLEEFCIKYQVNPINVWYWFKEEKFLPDSVASEYALEFLADRFRALLMEDEDGIIPLVGLPGEDSLSKRLEQYCLQKGFTSAQFIQLDGLLGKPLNQYIEHHFFSAFTDHIKLFKQMPSTPFIWHLSSGQHQGFEAYILIYKWNRDSLFKLKSQYISHRVQNLEYRQITLQDVNTAQAQTEKETIRLQLQEIKLFTTKIDELIAEGYDPKLDDGVGKNIAPLQKKGLLRAEVLKANQLTKYLNADW